MYAHRPEGGGLQRMDFQPLRATPEIFQRLKQVVRPGGKLEWIHSVGTMPEAPVAGSAICDGKLPRTAEAGRLRRRLVGDVGRPLREGFSWKAEVFSAIATAVLGMTFRTILVTGSALIAVALANFAAKCGAPSRPARYFTVGAAGFEPGRALSERKLSSPKTRDTQVTAEPFLTRTMSGLYSPAELLWSSRNGFTKPLAFAHNLSTVFPPELYDRRPELFPLVKGERLRPAAGSWYWNPDIARPDAAVHAADAARRHFASASESQSFALGTNDGLVWGESNELIELTHPRRWFRGRPVYSNLVFTFMNRVSDELSRTFPLKYIGCLAYFWSEQAPEFPLHPMVVPFLTADRAQDYDPQFRSEEEALQLRWARLGRLPSGSVSPPPRMGLYDYSYGYGFLIPRIYTRALARYVQRARALGFTDYYSEVAPNWGLDPLTPWLTAQLALAPDRPVEELKAEFFERYFGPAAGGMARFFELAEVIWARQPPPAYWLKHYRNESQAKLFSAGDLAELRSFLDEATAAAASPKIAARVARVARSFGLTERWIAFHGARDRLSRTVLAGDARPGDVSESLGEYRDARTEFIRYGIALKREDASAFFPIPWSDFLKNDPAGMAELAVRNRLENNRRQLLVNARLGGGLAAGKEIAGLPYGLPVPAGWSSRVEPFERHRAEWLDSPEGRILRLAGTADTAFQQWISGEAGREHRASVEVRGRVSLGCAVSLNLAWIDSRDRHLAFRSVRLPDGDWTSRWVTLRQFGSPPPGSVKVGIGVRVQNQVAGDWIEVRNFELAETL